METIHRKKHRLSPHLYNEWLYFVTINVKGWKRVLSKIVGWEAVLNTYWEIVENSWNHIIEVYTGVEVSDLIVMPNHIHGIVLLKDNNRECSKAINNRPYAEQSEKKYGMLSRIIKWLKQYSTKKIRATWYNWFQRHTSYYDRIIRNESELERVQEYIANNPLKRELEGK